MPTAITNLRIAASGSSNHALRDDAGHPGLLATRNRHGHWTLQPSQRPRRDRLAGGALTG
jgi:hypothetical protein